MVNLEVRLNISGSKFEFLYDFDGGGISHVLSIPQNLDGTRLNLAAAKIAVMARPIRSHNIYLRDNMELDAFTHDALEKSTNSKIHCRVVSSKSDYNYKTKPQQTLVAFSGGFDSVSAVALLGGDIKLFSVDFLGWFKRERNFFDKFNTDIFEWNIRQRRVDGTLYDESLDYRFLISPCTFYVNDFTTGLVTGTILEASSYQYTDKLRNNFSSYNSGVYGEGIYPIPIISSLSEFCTAKVARLFLGEDKIYESLESLAFQNSFKYYRKKCLLAAIEGAPLPDRPANIPKHVFGNYLTDDIIALYFIWKYGSNAVFDNYCEVVEKDLLLGLDMSFFERVNDNNLRQVDPVMRSEFLRMCLRYDIDIYRDGDLELLGKSISIRHAIEKQLTKLQQ